MTDNHIRNVSARLNIALPLHGCANLIDLVISLYFFFGLFSGSGCVRGAFDLRA